MPPIAEKRWGLKNFNWCLQSPKNDEDLKNFNWCLQSPKNDEDLKNFNRCLQSPKNDEDLQNFLESLRYIFTRLKSRTSDKVFLQNFWKKANMQSGNTLYFENSSLLGGLIKNPP